MRLRIVSILCVFISCLVIFALAYTKKRELFGGWSKSHTWCGHGGEGDDGVSWWISASPGRIAFVRCDFDSGYPNDLPPDTPPEHSYTSGFFWHSDAPTAAENDDPTSHPTTFGFAIMDEHQDLSSHSRQYYRALIIPHWLVLLLAITPTALCAMRLVQRGRLSLLGRCAACGYDLRMTPRRCPECGLVPVASGNDS